MLWENDFRKYVSVTDLFYKKHMSPQEAELVNDNNKKQQHKKPLCGFCLSHDKQWKMRDYEQISSTNKILSR